MPCLCWILWLLLPIIFLIGFMHKPTGDRLRLWITMMLEKWHRMEIKWITPTKVTNCDVVTTQGMS